MNQRTHDEPAAWHVDDQVWTAYRQGALSPATEASVEMHVVGCAHCQSVARGQVAAVELDAVWQQIGAEVRRPERPVALRWLGRLGVPDDDLVLLGAAGGFAIPWATAVGGALIAVLLAALMPVRAEETFLLLTPLIPVLSVAAAFEAIDPIRALTTSAPYSKLRLALLRTSATLVVALPATTAIGFVVPGLDWLAYRWLLPSLFLTVSALVLITWLHPWTAAGAVAVGWAALVVGTAHQHRLDSLAAPIAQASFLVAGLVLAGAFVLRTTSLRLMGGEC